MFMCIFCFNFPCVPLLATDIAFKSPCNGIYSSSLGQKRLTPARNPRYRGTKEKRNFHKCFL